MNKSWYKSKTIWGIIIATVMTILNYFNINFALPGADAETVHLGQELISLIAVVYALWGRIKAETGSGESKAWYKSKTVWGIIISFASTILAYFHINIPIPMDTFGLSVDQQATDAGNMVTSQIGLILAIVGRVKADKSISWK